jgi:hypothetical protein
LLKIERTRPTLKTKPPTQLNLLPNPQPPTEHREPPNLVRDERTLTGKSVRVLSSLIEAIDYDKLSPTQQAKWDLGMFGRIELKTIKGFQYYYLRWYDPEDRRNRSTYLGKTWDKAIAKLKVLTGH